MKISRTAFQVISLRAAKAAYNRISFGSVVNTFTTSRASMQGADERLLVASLPASTLFANHDRFREIK